MLDVKTMTQLSPDLLRTFVTAADTGSFTRAGKMVNRTQSAVSMQMKRLETDLDRPLFRRKGRGVMLTAEGDTLYRYARRLLALHDEALAAVCGPKLNGTVRFGAPEDYAAQFLPKTLQRFAAAYPMVEVNVLCGPSASLRKRFEREELDVMLTTEENSGAAHCRELKLTWIVAERGGPLEISPLPLALYHDGCPYRRNALSALEQAGIAYRIAYGVPSMAGVAAAVQAGLAVAPVSRDSRIKGCRQATQEDGLPAIASVAIGLQKAPGQDSDAVTAFHAFIGQELGLPEPRSKTTGNSLSASS